MMISLSRDIHLVFQVLLSFYDFSEVCLQLLPHAFKSLVGHIYVVMCTVNAIEADAALDRLSDGEEVEIESALHLVQDHWSVIQEVIFVQDINFLGPLNYSIVRTCLVFTVPFFQPFKDVVVDF